MQRRRRVTKLLAEPLIVTAVLLMLAAIAFPAFSSHRKLGFNERAATDLRRLARAQEEHFRDHHAYTSNLSRLESFAKPGHVTIRVSEVTSTSFKAIALHDWGDQTFEWDPAAMAPKPLGDTANKPGGAAPSAPPGMVQK